MNKHFGNRISNWVEDMNKNIARVLFLCVSLVTGFRALSAGTEKAWDHFKKHEYALAAAEFERLLTQDMDDAPTREGLGWSYYWLGKYDQAEMEFSKALETDPQSAGARNGLAEVKKWRYLVFNNAWQLFYSQDYQNALISFRSILEDKTNRLPASELWKVHSGMGWCFYYVQNYTSAEKEFQSILSIYEGNPYALKGLGFTLYQLGKFDGSLDALKEALAGHPEWSDVQSMIGWVVYSKGDYKEALVEFQKALDVNKMLADAWYGMAWTCAKMGQSAEALEHFRKAIKISPYHPGNYSLSELIDRDKSWWGLYPEWSWSYYLAKDYVASEKMFSESLKRLPDDLDMNRGRAFSLFKLGNYSEVVKILTQIKAAGSKLPPVIETGFGTDGLEYTVRSNINSILAWSYYYLGDLTKAQTLFEEEIGANPDWTDLYAGLGWCALKADKLDAAEKYLKKSVELNSSYSAALTGLSEVRKRRYIDFNDAWSAFYAGDKQTAFEKFSLVAQSGLQNIEEKDRWQAFSGMGYCMLDFGKPKEAIGQFNKALEMAPGNFYAHLGLAKAYYSQSAFVEAEKNVSAVLKVSAELADVWSLKGWILMDQKKNKDAETAFRRSLEVSPTDPDGLAGMGWVNLDNGRKSEAAGYFKTVLNISPDHIKAKEGLARAQQ